MNLVYFLVPVSFFGISLILAVLIAGFLVPFLTHNKVGQVIREDGPRSHHSKAGTPTMGGFIFIIPFIVVSMGYLFAKPELLILLLVVIIFAVLGYLDDSKIVSKSSNKGLSVKLRLGVQLGVGLLLGIFLYFFHGNGITHIPHTPISLDLGYFYIAFVAFIIAGVTNAANLTDGLDGLAGTVSLVTILSFLAVFIMLGQYQWYSVIMILVAGLIIFLYYNRHPAKIFMGNVGSLFLGSFIATMALMSGLELLLIPFAIVFMFETISVILQVTYFKITKALSKTKEGKRLFRMSPLHHHFELSGWHETKVVKVFALTQAAVSLVAIAILAYFIFFTSI